AFMRCAAKRHFNHRIDVEETDLGLVRRPANLINGNNSLGRKNDAVGSHCQIDVHEWQSVYLGIAVGITTLNVNKRHVGIDSGNQQQRFVGKQAVDLLDLGAQAYNVRADHGTHGHERHTHRTSLETHAHAKMAPFLETGLLAFDVMAHDLGNAPDDALA